MYFIFLQDQIYQSGTLWLALASSHSGVSESCWAARLPSAGFAAAFAGMRTGIPKMLKRCFSSPSNSIRNAKTERNQLTLMRKAPFSFHSEETLKKRNF